jgi:hypothetical protein
MPIPRPFDLETFVSNIEAARGRRIKLLPIPDRFLRSTDICGLWLKHEELPLDLIFHVDSTTSFHRQRIIFHELAHLWCDDAGGVTGVELERLLPDFPPELLMRLLGRGRAMARRRYGTRKELRAELMADLIHKEAFGAEFIEDDTLRRLDETLTHPVQPAPLPSGATHG